MSDTGPKGLKLFQKNASLYRIIGFELNVSCRRIIIPSADGSRRCLKLKWKVIYTWLRQQYFSIEPLSKTGHLLNECHGWFHLHDITRLWGAQIENYDIKKILLTVEFEPGTFRVRRESANHCAARSDIYREIELRCSLFLSCWEKTINSTSYEYRKISARGGTPFVPIGMSTACWDTSPAKQRNDVKFCPYKCAMYC